LFGDGGILSLGANAFNVAFVMPFLGYSVFALVSRAIKGEKGEVAGLAAGSFVGINAAALCTAIELGLQPLLFTYSGRPLYCPYPLTVTLPAMLIPHLVIVGAVEALFSVGIFTFIRRVSPGTIRGRSGIGLKPLYGLLIVLIILTPLGLLAAGAAWGEWGAQEIAGVAIEGKPLGFVPEGMLNGWGIRAIFPDYSVGGVPDVAGYLIAAVAGVAVIIIAFKLLAMLKSRGKV
jgi:cobalt/nickel transport system permease protein